MDISALIGHAEPSGQQQPDNSPTKSSPYINLERESEEILIPEFPSVEKSHLPFDLQNYGSYTFTWEQPAANVFVTGDFDGWQKSAKLEEEGGILKKTLVLPKVSTMYKYVVDGKWVYKTLERRDYSRGIWNNILLPEDFDILPLGQRPYKEEIGGGGKSGFDSMNPLAAQQSNTIDSKLDQILWTLGNESVRQAFKNHDVSDLWLPFQKQMLQKLIPDNQDKRSFLQAQDNVLDPEIKVWNENHPKEAYSFFHSTIGDDEDIVEEHRMLGEGAFGIVEEISITTPTSSIRCVRKRFGRPRQLKAQKQIMAAFAREIKVMRQVEFQHCVQFLGSYTDLDHVNILSNPVADMDLATMLDQPINAKEQQFLYRGIGCLCNALNYLHRNNIRHEDLKPQNVLVHGDNILLTDFGFSLDFSEDSVSTTTGRPAAWTIRYSAPEVLNFEPRNRASDIFSLGCVLIEMISGIYGSSLTQMKEFWKRTGNGQSSFARNSVARQEWIQNVMYRVMFESTKVGILCSFIEMTFIEERLYRPTVQQMVDRISDVSILLHNEALDHINGECTGRIPCIGLSDRIRAAANASFDATHLIKFPSLIAYLHPKLYTDWNCELYDLNWDLVATSTPETLSNRSTIVKANDKFRQAGSEVYASASRTGTTREFWRAHAQRKEKGLPKEAVNHVRISFQMILLKHVVFTRVWMRYGKMGFRLENSDYGVVQITLLPICLPRSPYYGSFFWMVSYPSPEHASRVVMGPCDTIVDLTTESR